jgi:predicted MFS family arabinose efflux permease
MASVAGSKDKQINSERAAPGAAKEGVAESTSGTKPTESGTATGAPMGGATRPAVVIAILFLVFFLGMSDNQMVSPLLPLMSKEFHLPEGDIGKMIAPAYALAAAIAALIVGPASDQLGRRRFLLIASIVFGLSLLSVGFIRDIHTLAAVRFFTGLAAGTFSTCSIAYVGDYFPYYKRGSAMSIVQSGYFVALVVGVPLGSLLAQWRGWRAGFLAFGALAVVVFFMVLSLLPEDGHKLKHVPLSGDASGWFRNVALVFHTKERIAAIAGAFFVSGGFVGFILYMGSWLTTTHGLKTGQVGLVFAIVGISSLIGAIAAGPIADKIGKRGVSLVSTIILALTLLLIPILGWGPLLFGTFLVASLSYAFRQGPVQALATELVPRRARGALVATRTTASQVGIGISTAVCGMLYDSSGYRAVGLFCAVMSLAAAVCIFLMKEPAHRPSEEW